MFEQIHLYYETGNYTLAYLTYGDSENFIFKVTQFNKVYEFSEGDFEHEKFICPSKLQEFLKL